MTADNGHLVIEDIAGAIQSRKPYEVVLTDMHMPGFDGHEAIRTLHEMRYTDLPIIEPTAQAMTGYREHLLKPDATIICPDRKRKMFW